jgi:hypothetical protein
MEIGKPKRIYRVEPLRDPVPKEPKRAQPEPPKTPKEWTVAPSR